MPQPITGTRLLDRVFLLIDGRYCATPGSLAVMKIRRCIIIPKGGDYYETG